MTYRFVHVRGLLQQRNVFFRPFENPYNFGREICETLINSLISLENRIIVHSTFHGVLICLRQNKYLPSNLKQDIDEDIS